VIRPPVRHPLPAVIGAVSVLMCVGAVYAGLHGVRQAHIPPPLLAERSITYPTIGVAGASAKGWIDLTHIQANLQVSYISMEKKVNSSLFRWIEMNADGARPVIDIEPYNRSLASVATGGADGWLRALKLGIEAMNRPVVVAFAPEANGNWYSWGLQPGPFRRAWQHVWDIVGSVSKNKRNPDIIWMWQMSSSDGIHAYWPGKAYVNWVGIDGYFRTSHSTFGRIFKSTLATVKRLTKSDPILLSETAVGPKTEAQAADITKLFAGAEADHLIAVVWFQKKQSDLKHPAIHQDWRLKPETLALATFQHDAHKYLSSSHRTARKK